MSDPCYILLGAEEGGDTPSLQEFKNQLEKGDDEEKISAMKKLIQAMLNGENFPLLLMFVIRFVVVSKNKTLKKLCLIYWEIVPKKNPDGKLKQEFILVCNALRSDLLHPNEYVRGSTLRFLCKLKEAEIFEPLVPSIRACLEHRHSYVKKNAVLAIYMIYKQFESLIPDAPELIYNFLSSEPDMSCKRNAFIMLYNCDQRRAVDYLSSTLHMVPSFGEGLQLVIVELIRKVCKTNPAEKARFLRCIYELLNSPSSAVKYESAAALMSVTSAPTAVKAVATCYISLIQKESDNNVKLIVLDRLSELREKNESAVDDLVMDLLRVLSSPDIEVKRKCLSIAMEMVNSRNVSDILSFLKKEISKTHDQDYEKNAEYRQYLVQSVHHCAIKFPDMAASVVHTLMDFMGESNSEASSDVIIFVKEVVEKFEALRQPIMQKLIGSLAEMKDAKVFRGALWIIGEYSSDYPTIQSAFESIRSIIGEIPIVASELREAEALVEKQQQDLTASMSGSSPALSAPPTRVVVLPDGTYSTQSVFSVKETAKNNISTRKSKPLRKILMEGDFFLGALLASTLTKLSLRFASVAKDPAQANAQAAESMLIITSILRLGKSEIVMQEIDADCYERIAFCLRALLEPNEVTSRTFLVDSRFTFTAMLNAKKKQEAEKKTTEKKSTSKAEDILLFRQLQNKRGVAGEDEEEDRLDKQVSMATGAGEDSDSDGVLSKLSRIVQLTGHSDPVYAEAYVTVHQYDILLDILLVNQTNETLQNLTFELATLGDLKLVERPSTHNLAPNDFLSIKANIKVSSTETGVIFGNIVYDTTGASESKLVVLNEIHIDVMDYIHPQTCTETAFRQMWSEFEWENKLSVNSTITDLRKYLAHIQSQTNMKCLTPSYAMEGECDFLAANLYARSIFGEDALANISIEKTANGTLAGAIRIRSKTQGLALSLGDKITLTQRTSGEE